MDIVTILGLVLGCSLMIFGIVSGGGALMGFVSVPSLVIVLGGTIAALIVSYPLEFLKDVPRHFKIVFKKEEHDPSEYIVIICELAKEARKKGLLALEEKAEEQENRFLRDSIALIVDAIEPERVKKILDSKMGFMQERHDQAVGFYEKASALAPAFGMLGTVIGLINMLGDLSDPDSLGAGMAVALVTTLYGSFLANMLFTPFSNKLQYKNEREMLCMEIIVEGVTAIQAGENPRHIEEKLSSYLSGAIRDKMAAQQENNDK